jgi:hypothetical protein
MPNDRDRGSVKSSTLIAYVLSSQLSHRSLADDHLADNNVTGAGDDVPQGLQNFQSLLKRRRYTQGLVSVSG